MPDGYCFASYIILQEVSMSKTNDDDFELFPWWLIAIFIVISVCIGVWTYISLKV
jgi:hypothetical protein